MKFFTFYSDMPFYYLTFLLCKLFALSGACLLVAVFSVPNQERKDGRQEGGANPEPVHNRKVVNCFTVNHGFVSLDEDAVHNILQAGTEIACYAHHA